MSCLPLFRLPTLVHHLIFCSYLLLFSFLHMIILDNPCLSCCQLLLNAGSVSSYIVGRLKIDGATVSMTFQQGTGFKFVVNIESMDG